MNLSEESALPMIDEDAVNHIPKNPPQTPTGGGVEPPIKSFKSEGGGGRKGGGAGA